MCNEVKVFLKSYLHFDMQQRFYKTLARARTATEIDGILHTDFHKSETSRDIKKYF